MPKKAAISGVVIVILVLLTSLISGCAKPAEETESPEEVEVTEEQVETEEPTVEPTDTAQPSDTPAPTATSTPKPTKTPVPTATDTPLPAAGNSEATEEPAEQDSTTEPTQEEEASVEPTQEEEAGEVVPPGESVWVLDTEASETGSSAECPAPFYADFYGLVRIETIDNGVTWMRAQDGITYTLLRQSPNVYWGTGASIYPGYTLTISVVFTSSNGLGATFVLIDQAIEGCNHYWKYGGTLR